MNNANKSLNIILCDKPVRITNLKKGGELPINNLTSFLWLLLYVSLVNTNHIHDFKLRLVLLECYVWAPLIISYQNHADGSLVKLESLSVNSSKPLIHCKVRPLLTSVQTFGTTLHTHFQ